MKLKLKQKIAIRLYKTKFKAISLISNKLAAKNLFKLFCTPYSGKPKRKQPPFFKKAKTIDIVFEKLTVRGWQWIPANCNGNKVLVIHGFDSCSYKSEPIINKLYLSGYEVLAFDAPGHGISDGKTINAKQYSEIISLIDNNFGKMYAFVAHSLGGLAASLAVEKYCKDLPKLVLIAPATETTTAIDNFFKFLKMPLHLKPEIENLIVEMSGQQPSYFSVSRSIKNFENSTLWIHDQNDFICPIADVLPIKKLNLPHIEFYFTKKLGHNLVYRNKEVLNKIIQFLNS